MCGRASSRPRERPGPRRRSSAFEASCRLPRRAPQRSWRGSLTLLGLLQASLEALDLARSVDQALLARKERMAGRAHVDVQVLLRRARLPRVATTTGDR